MSFVAGSAHATLSAFPEWKGAKLVCALSQGMYWLLVARADLGIGRGETEALKGLRIGAAPWVDIGLKRLLRETGLNPETDVTIAPVPGAVAGVSFGVMAARALEEGTIDAFWANGMGSELAVTRGVGTVVLDPRRGLGPKVSFHYTQPVLATTEQMIDRSPETVAAAVRAIVRVQRALKSDIDLATEVGRKSFPETEASLIAQVVARDLPFYDPVISQEFVAGMNRFALEMGLPAGDPQFEDVVETRFSNLWSE